MTTLPPRLPLCALLALAFPALPSFGQAQSLPAADDPVTHAVVVTGTRIDERYGAGQAGIAKGSPSLRETPQSVTVLTRERLDDQNLRSLDEALQVSTGIVVEQGSSYERSFYSRGFLVDTVQYDGVPTQRGNGFAISPDLAVFERVEVLRGPAGLFNGAGQPGGTVNLVRKRPLKAAQLAARLSAGRWDDYRAEGDASVLLNAAGTLRARVVGVGQERKFFYAAAHTRHRVGYAVFEADLGPATTLGAGVDVERNLMRPFYGGLPRYSDGRDLDLPRDTYLNAAWSHTDVKTSTAFADLRHRFQAGWNGKIGVTHMREANDDLSGSAFGTVNVATGARPTLSSFGQKLVGDQDAVDATLEGGFDAFGRRHDVLVGANWQQRDYDLGSQLYRVTNPSIDPFTFDPFAYAVAPTVPARAAAHTHNLLRQSGVYGSLRLALAEHVKLVLGGRVSNFETSTRNLVTDAWTIAPFEENHKFTPYGALSVDLARDWTGYLSYAEIFRSQANLVTANGQPLKAATGSNVEAGLKGELAGGRLNAALALFRVLEDGRSQVDAGQPTPCPASPLGGSCYVAEGKVRSQGLDAEVNGGVLPGVELAAGYTFNQTRYLRDRGASGTPSANENQPLSTFTPKHIARLWANWQPSGAWSAWSAGAGVNAQSLAYKTSGALRIEQRGYAIWSGRVGYRIDRNLDLALNLNNLFDKRYYRTLGSTSGGNWYGEPRNLAATLRAIF